MLFSSALRRHPLCLLEGKSPHLHLIHRKRLKNSLRLWVDDFISSIQMKMLHQRYANTRGEICVLGVVYQQREDLECPTSYTLDVHLSARLPLQNDDSAHMIILSPLHWYPLECNSLQPYIWCFFQLSLPNRTALAYWMYLPTTRQMQAKVEKLVIWQLELKSL